MNCPRSAKAGQDLFSVFQVAVANHGAKAVKDVEVDMVLAKSAQCPRSGRAPVYSPDFFDGVLLREGRHYVSVDPGQTVTIKPHGANTIPGNTPAGRSYFICAVIAAGDREKGGNDPGQCACCPIKIIGTEDRPEITGFSETCVTRGGTVTIRGRNFGTGAAKAVVLEVDGVNLDLTVISWGDAAIVARMPDASGIRDEKVYSIGIQRGDHTDMLSNRKSIAICPATKPQKLPTPVPPIAPPVAPFLF
jgi:hypothetical protein